jgi:hypothetical protein
MSLGAAAAVVPGAGDEIVRSARRARAAAAETNTRVVRTRPSFAFSRRRNVRLRRRCVESYERSRELSVLLGFAAEPVLEWAVLDDDELLEVVVLEVLQGALDSGPNASALDDAG